MGLGSITEKLDKYFGRLEDGRAAKIKPAHVEKVIAKLSAKQASLQSELGEAEKPAKKVRLENKMATVREQIERAEYVLQKISA